MDFEICGGFWVASSVPNSPSYRILVVILPTGLCWYYYYYIIGSTARACIRFSLRFWIFPGFFGLFDIRVIFGVRERPIWATFQFLMFGYSENIESVLQFSHSSEVVEATPVFPRPPVSGEMLDSLDPQ